MESITLQFRSLLCFSEPPGCPLPPGTESVDLGPFEMVLFWPQRTNLRAIEPHRNGKCWCSSMSLLEVFAASTLLVIPCLTSVCSSWLHALISADLARSWVLSTEPSAWSMFVKKKKQTARLVEGVLTWMFFGAAGPRVSWRLYVLKQTCWPHTQCDFGLKFSVN